MVAATAFVLLLLPVNLVGPGLFAVRRLHWAPAEKLCGAVGLSLIWLYLTSFLIYLLNLPQATFYGVSLLGLLSAIACRADLLRLWRHRSTRRCLAAFGLLLAWSTLWSMLVRHFSGATWWGDWQEHYERTRFFLEHGPSDYRFLHLYPLPARPPFMNLVAGHFLAQAGNSFTLFQIVFLFLNLLIVLPLWLMSAVFSPGGRRSAVVFGFLALNPMLLQNLSFTWTKLLTGYFVVLALWFYLAAWRKSDPVRWKAASVSVAAGVLVHYSAVPYALCLGLHYLVVVFPRQQRRWGAALAAAIPSLALLVTWFSWSLAVYGVGATAASNTTAQGFGTTAPRANVVKVIKNLYGTLLPPPTSFRRAVFNDYFRQPSRLGYWRDYTFYYFQQNLLFALGSVGGLLVPLLLPRALRAVARPMARFWLWFILFSAVVGIAVHPTDWPGGVARICCQPLVLLGVTFLGARFSVLPAAVRCLALAGCAVDFALGIFLHFSLENRVFPFERVGGVIVPQAPAELLSLPAVQNYVAKSDANLAYWGDRLSGTAGVLEVAAAVAFVGIMAWLLIAGLRTSHLVSQRSR
jgi:hypothetical protein